MGKTKDPVKLAKERLERDDEDLVRLYLTDIGQYPLLTKDDEVRLAQAIEAGREADAQLAAAPKGLFLVGPPVLELDGDTGSGEQPLCFVDQTNHAMRIGYYTDTYRRTEQGWRLHTRSMTFLRKSGAQDSGRPHDPTRPAPGAR